MEAVCKAFFEIMLIKQNSRQENIGSTLGFNCEWLDRIQDFPTLSFLGVKAFTWCLKNDNSPDLSLQINIFTSIKHFILEYNPFPPISHPSSYPKENR